MKKDVAITLIHKISRKIGLEERVGGPYESNIFSRLEDLLAQEQRAANLHDEAGEFRAQLKDLLPAIVTALAIADRDTDAFSAARVAVANLRALAAPKAQEAPAGGLAPGGKAQPPPLESDPAVEAARAAVQREYQKKETELRAALIDSMVCKCGHRHASHHPIRSVNYSAGNCKECGCRGFVIDPAAPAGEGEPLPAPAALGCAHGRGPGQPCPHCMGLGAVGTPSLGTLSATGTIATAPAPTSPAGRECWVEWHRGKITGSVMSVDPGPDFAQGGAEWVRMVEAPPEAGAPGAQEGGAQA